MPDSKPPIPPELFDAAAEMLKAISHPLRLRILDILDRERELHVTDICERTGASQPSVSQQLSRMRLTGVLTARREGTSVYYSVARPAVLGVLQCIRSMVAD